MHIAILIGNRVSCLACSSKTGESGSKLWAENIGDYKQTCHDCGKVLAEGKTPAWCELYPKEKAVRTRGRPSLQIHLGRHRPRMNITLSPLARTRLADMAQDRNLSESRMIEALILSEAPDSAA